jgi:hypothetical protein
MVRPTDRVPSEHTMGETSDRHAYPDTGDTGGKGRKRRSGGGTPRWITVLGVAVAVLVVLMFVFLHLSGAVGPGVH